MKYFLALALCAALASSGDCQRFGKINGPSHGPRPAAPPQQSQSADSSEEGQGHRMHGGGGGPQRVGGGPCKIVDLVANVTTEGTPCPANSACDFVDPRNPNPNLQIYLCNPPAGNSGFGFGFGPCKVIDKTTNATTESRPCPDGVSCDFLDLMNPNPNFQVYLCSPPAFRPVRQPCKVIDLTTNTTTDGPATCPTNSTCSVPELVATQPNVQNLYCSRPFMMFSGRSPPCRSVVVATNETVDLHPCRPDSTCTVLDTANTDPSVELYLCTPFTDQSRHNGRRHH